MNIRYGLRSEAYKLSLGNTFIFKPASIDTFGTTAELCAGRGDTAAAQLVVWCDRDWALNVGSVGWIPQDLERAVIRVSADCPFPVTLNIIDMMQDDDNRLRADPLLTDDVLELAKGDTRAVFIEIAVPADAEPGSYTCRVRVSVKTEPIADETALGDCTLDLTVADYLVPDVASQKLHLDLWQHSSNLARKHEVPLWSDAHFEVLEKYVRSLGELGQKAATCIVSEIPWSGQSCYGEHLHAANLFEYSIIPVVKKKDGSFVYDFSKMQRYIDLCAKYHIDREISVYGLANIWDGEGNFPKPSDYPDGVRIRYLDESDGLYKFMHTCAEVDDYIKALETYFITTGQIGKVRLAADEPGDVAAYRKSIHHLLSVAPAFRCKAAINHTEFITEFEKEIYDFVPYIQMLSEGYDDLMRFKATMKGKRFLWYVCCGPSYPNTFLRSGLTESYFLGVLTSYANLDGFLRWDYTVFNDDPRTDVRYSLFPAGDANFVYPAKNGAPLLTLRYKALRRGVEFYELLERLRDTGDAEALEKAYGMVVREKDIRQYYKTPHALSDMCAVDYEDYAALRKYLLETLAEKSAK